MQLPEFIRSFPSLDIPFPEDVVSTNAIQSGEGLAVFFTFHKDADLPPHSHKGQWGTVLEGSITITMNDETRTYRPGECYSVGSGVVHAVKVPAGTKVIDVFEESDRYRIKA
jgi:quercetin dioxygenase-like cupin family protein